MARTIAQINTEIQSNFIANPTIQSFYGITPGSTFDAEFSKVSFERVLFYILAVSIWVLESNFDELKTHVDTKVAEAKRWSLPVLVQDAKAFQLGDALQWINGEYRYAATNTDAMVVTYAAAQEIGSSVILKVATVGGVNGIQELSPLQLSAFSDYIRQLKPPGVDLLVVSRPADTLKIYYRIYINPLVLNLSGGLVTDPGVKPVETAIKAYCKSLDFNGRFDVTALTDVLQKIPGVLAPVFQQAFVRYGLNDYQEFADFYTPNAGYLAIDNDNQLDVTLSYFLLP